MTDKYKHISKFLSLVLRHRPEAIGITLDEQGWADTTDLIEKINKHNNELDFNTLKQIVDTNPKKRFIFDPSFQKIRANQGHSVPIDLALETQTPPLVLYHGTAQQFVPSILETGIEKLNRQHVHLSKEKETALKVGQRHGKPVIITVLAQQMAQDGYTFYLSENGVWLTEQVPVRYLRIL